MTGYRYGRETDGPTPREWAEAVLLQQRIRRAAAAPAASGPPDDPVDPAPDTPPAPEPAAPPAPAEDEREDDPHALEPPAPEGGVPEGTAGAAAAEARWPGYVHVRTTGGTGPAAVHAAWPWGADESQGQVELSDPLGLGRALRPFGRRRASVHRFTLDEEGTAVRAAEQGFWEPVFHGAGEHWFDVVLVVEDSVSMSVWDGAARALTDVFQRQGAFSDVRTWRLDTWRPGEVVLRPDGSAADRDPQELLHPQRRRLILLLSDCVGEGWSRGTVPRLLDLWARHGPVAVLNPLPHHMWDRCDAIPLDVSLRACAGGLPNTELGLRLPGPAPGDPDADGAEGTDGPLPGEGPPEDRPVPVPVLEIEPEWLATWARLVTGTGGGWLPAAALLTDASGLAARCAAVPRTPEDDDPLAPDERVRNFRAAASPAARLLASHLALAPLTLDVMEKVKKAVLPRLGPLPLAEVLLSGLLERPAPAAAGFTGFAFRDGVRNQLLGGLGRGELFRALQGVSAVAAKVIGARPDLLPRYLAAPDGPVDDRLTPAERELAAAAHPALLALGRPYSRLAQKVRVLVDPPPSPPETDDRSDLPGVRTKGETMSGSAPDTERLTSSTPAGAPPSGPPQENGAAPDGPPGSAPDQSPAGAPPGGGVRAPGSVPLPNANFTGREEHLRMLRSYLTEGRRAAVLPQALYGLGGVGKTQLAIEYIRRYAEEYELVWWVRAEQPAVIRTSLSALGSTLGIEGPDVDGVVDKVISALASGFPVKRWLLVLDNALGPEDVMPYIPHMVGVPGGAGHVIITSRDGGWADQVSALKVDVFTRDESIEFLRRRDTTMTGEDASRLADALGDLPLAIEQAAAWQVNSGVQVEEYLGLLASRRSEVFAEPMTVGGAASVAAVWQVSMDSLRARNAGALELLRLLAFFGPEPVPLSLLHNARLLSLPAALSRTVKEPLNRARAIRDIGRYSLLTIDNRAGTVQLHRLVRSVLQDGLDAGTAESTAHLAHLLLSAHDPGDPEMLRNWEQYTEILPHVETSGMLECQDPDVCHTVLNVVRYLLARGDFRSGVELARRALKEWRRGLGPDDLRTINLVRLLGAAQRSLGRLDEARELNADALRRLRATVGEEHEDTLNLAGGVAADLRATGRFREALELDEDTYAKSVRVFGTDDPNTLMAGHNYAVSLRLSGLFTQARELDRKVWQVRAMVLGATARSTLFTVNNLARDMRECGEYAEARTLQEQTVATYRQYYGETHPHTLRAIKNLSVSCRKAGDYERGLELAVLVLDHYRRTAGDRHPDALAALTNLGNDLRMTGDLQAAGQRGAEAHQGYREVLGEHHPYTYLAALNHAVTLRALGEHPRAHRLDQDTATGIAGTLWADHPWVLLSRANLATDLARLGNHEESRVLNTEISARLETLLGDSHPSTLAVLRNLALDLETAGEPDRSRELTETVLGRYRTTIGDDHPEARAAAEGIRAEWDIEPPPS